MIIVTRRQTFRLYPNKAQEKALFEARRLHAYLYNACISHRQFEYKVNSKSVDYSNPKSVVRSIDFTLTLNPSP